MSKIKVLSTVDKDTFPDVWFLYADEEHFWCKARVEYFLQLVKNTISPHEKLVGLDVGCGNGVVRRQLHSYTNWTIDGCDVSVGALEINHTKGETYLYNIHERNTSLKEKYDFVILFDVLEHIENHGDFLASIYFHLKPGGILCINVPAFEILRSHFDDIAGHVRRYKKNDLFHLLESRNYTPLHLMYWGTVLTPLAYLRKFTTKGANSEEAIQRGFQPSSPLINTLLGGIMKIERYILKYRPFGTSLMAIAKKDR